MLILLTILYFIFNTDGFVRWKIFNYYYILQHPSLNIPLCNAFMPCKGGYVMIMKYFINGYYNIIFILIHFEDTDFRYGKCTF